MKTVFLLSALAMATTKPEHFHHDSRCRVPVVGRMVNIYNSTAIDTVYIERCDGARYYVDKNGVRLSVGEWIFEEVDK